MSQQSPSLSLYFVRSSKNPNLFYRVAETPGQVVRWHCECPAGQFGRACWHTRVCIDGAVRPARLKATATPAPAQPAPPPTPAPERDRGFTPMPGFINPNDEPRRRTPVPVDPRAERAGWLYA